MRTVPLKLDKIKAGVKVQYTPYRQMPDFNGIYRITLATRDKKGFVDATMIGVGSGAGVHGAFNYVFIEQHEFEYSGWAMFEDYKEFTDEEYEALLV